MHSEITIHRFGCPQWLVDLTDTITQGMPSAVSVRFLKDLIEAVQVSADPNAIRAPFIVRLQERNASRGWGEGYAAAPDLAEDAAEAAAEAAMYSARVMADGARIPLMYLAMGAVAAAVAAAWAAKVAEGATAAESTAAGEEAASAERAAQRADLLELLRGIPQN